MSLNFSYSDGFLSDGRQSLNIHTAAVAGTRAINTLLKMSTHTVRIDISVIRIPNIENIAKASPREGLFFL